MCTGLISGFSVARIAIHKDLKRTRRMRVCSRALTRHVGAREELIQAEPKFGVETQST
jgi:hypothetical protein